jgi:hypothetical protein
MKRQNFILIFVLVVSLAILISGGAKKGISVDEAEEESMAAADLYKELRWSPD